MNTISVSSLNNFLISPNFVFLSCVSFESRCRTVPSNIDTSRILKSYIFQFKEFTQYSDHNLSKIIETIPCSHHIMLSNSNPLQASDALHNIFIQLIGTYSSIDLVIDITTFTRESILVILYLIFHYRAKINSCIMLYNSSANMDNNWLSLKIKEFRSIIGYSGKILPTKKLHLTIILGFEVERARSIIDKYEPAILSIARGSNECSINKELCSKNIQFVEQLNSFYSNTPYNFEISIIDPLQAKNDLKTHIDKFSDYNNVIAPLNTKLSTLGAGLLALENQNIQICYTQMELYNFNDYSTPSENIYVFNLTQTPE